MAGLLKRLILGGNLRRTLIRAGILAVLAVLAFRFVLAPLHLDGTSMEPTYSHGQMSLANRLAYINSRPERGDVVALRLRDSGRSIFLLKRVVGLPGESIGFLDGKVTVDGVPLPEDYLSYESDWNRAPVLCEADEYFVVGDNRSMPIDRHTFGRATLSRIVGKAIF
ncbi:MAG: signal peptidase I [Opitutales bacterium]